MSHYITSYKNMSDTRARRQALLDCREFLGREKFEAVRAAIKESGVRTIDGLRMPLAMIGIQGYPVKVLFDAYCKQKEGLNG